MGYVFITIDNEEKENLKRAARRKGYSLSKYFLKTVRMFHELVEKESEYDKKIGRSYGQRGR